MEIAERERERRERERELGNNFIISTFICGTLRQR
jgi:hypothetical protein